MRRLERKDRLNADNIGECQFFYIRNFFDQRFWSIKILNVNFKEYEFKAVMMHEFAHCIHGARHLDTQVHIMNPYIPHESVLSNNWEDMLQDLAFFIKMENNQ